MTGLTTRYARRQFPPSTLLPGGHAVERDKVSLRDAIDRPPAEREVIPTEAVSSLLIVELANLLCVKAASHTLGKRCGVLP
jgi:hypothetical protein